MATLDDLRALGYDVAVAETPGDAPDVVRVAGYGLDAHYAADDAAAIDAVADGHDWRAFTAKHGGAARDVSRAAALGYDVALEAGKLRVAGDGTNQLLSADQLRAKLDAGGLERVAPSLARVEERIASAAAAAVGAVIPALAPNATQAQHDQAVAAARQAALAAVDAED